MTGFRRMADGGAVEPIAHLGSLLSRAPDALLRIRTDFQNLHLSEEPVPASA